jgi:hypothetical protein
MHPTDKAARVAGAIYLSLIFTAPFSLIDVGVVMIRSDGSETRNDER